MLRQYTCDRCGLHRRLRYLDRAYFLAEGRELPMEQRHFWCSTCNDISVAESLTYDGLTEEGTQKSVAELRRLLETPIEQLSHIERRTRNIAPQLILDVEQRWQDFAEWRARRTAQPKCLKCGEPAASLPESDAASLTHGGCGGALQCLMSIGSFNGPATYPHLYDVDGTLIQTGQKPRIRRDCSVEYLPMEVFSDETERG